MAIPIWKDTFYTKQGVTTYLDYSVSVAGSVIYTGRAYPRPGSTTVEIRVNNIVKDLFSDPANWQIFFYTYESLNVQRSITAVLTAGADTATYEFFYDWSYENRSAPRTTLAPIISRVASEQLIFINENNSVEARSLEEEGETFTTGGVTFTLGCGKFALYYVDKYGLWETFLLEGNCYIEDNLERNTIGIRSNNGAADEWGRRNTFNYHNKVTRRAILRTGWLTDKEAQNVDSLVGSVQVWLHDIGDTGEVLPVVVTDTTMKRKTYKNEGNALVRYEFTADIAYNYDRR